MRFNTGILISIVLQACTLEAVHCQSRCRGGSKIPAPTGPTRSRGSPIATVTGGDVVPTATGTGSNTDATKPNSSGTSVQTAAPTEGGSSTPPTSSDTAVQSTMTTGNGAALPTTAPTTAGSMTPGGKRGIVWAATTTPPAQLNSGIKWYYTWSPTPVAGFSGEFVPMLWGDKQISEFAKASSAKTYKYILGFNEPDRNDQADMTEAHAASVWKQYIAPLKNKGSLLGSPGPSVGSGAWLDNFKANGAEWDFTPLHVYTLDPEDAMAQINAQYKRYNKKIWLTEFACLHYGKTTTFGTPAQTTAFMKTLIPLLESSDAVAAYSWNGFNAGDNNMLIDGNGAITELGKLYASL